MLFMQKYTPEDLLLYLYQETSADKASAIESSLENDWTLREKLQVIKTAMQRLDSLHTSPRTQTVLNILKYAAKETELTPSK